MSFRCSFVVHRVSQLSRLVTALVRRQAISGSEMPLRPGSHGCKIWLFVREALQFPWILQQNLEAAARSAETGEARSGPKGSFSRCSGREKSRLQRLQCEVEVVKSRFFFLFFFFFFFFGKDKFLGK